MTTVQSHPAALDGTPVVSRRVAVRIGWVLPDGVALEWAIEPHGDAGWFATATFTDAAGARIVAGPHEATRGTDAQGLVHFVVPGHLSAVIEEAYVGGAPPRLLYAWTSQLARLNIAAGHAEPPALT